jgi:hypothetical protein
MACSTSLQYRYRIFTGGFLMDFMLLIAGITAAALAVYLLYVLFKGDSL